MGRRAAAGPPGPFPPLCPPTRPPPPREVRRMQYLKQFSYGLLLLFLFSPFLIACMGLRSMSVCVVGVPRHDRITRQWSRLGAFSSLCRPRLRGTPQPGRLGWEGWLLSPVLVGAGSRCCLAGALDLIPPPPRPHACQLCGHRQRLWTHCWEGAGVSSLCPVPSTFPWCLCGSVYLGCLALWQGFFHG